MLATYKHNLLTKIVVKSHTGKFLCLQSTNLQSTEKTYLYKSYTTDSINVTTCNSKFNNLECKFYSRTARVSLYLCMFSLSQSLRHIIDVSIGNMYI